MIRVNRLTDYASLILGEMCVHDSQSYSAGTLASELDLPFATVSKVLKLLTNAQILASTRGATGGYRLMRSAAEIRIVDIIEAIEGPIALTDCAMSSASCPHSDNCSMRGPWRMVNRKIYEVLSEVTLATMTKEMACPMS